MTHYFPEPDSSDPVVPKVLAALDDQLIVPWRKGIDGVQWYKTLPPIHGVPKSGAAAFADAELIEGEDDSDDSLEASDDVADKLEAALDSDDDLEFTDADGTTWII